jgi:hypothetical protein
MVINLRVNGQRGSGRRHKAWNKKMERCNVRDTGKGTYTGIGGGTRWAGIQIIKTAMLIVVLWPVIREFLGTRG